MSKIVNIFFLPFISIILIFVKFFEVLKPLPNILWRLKVGSTKSCIDFINQNKKNIPDIVCERILENPKYERPQKSCCILDAKYYGWDYEKEAYYLPRNLDIYKQFFYQEQFQRIYEKENETNVGVYNFLVLPDYLGDTKDTKWGIIRQCAVIEFDYHQNQKIAILQVDIEKLVDFIYSGLDMKEDVLSVFLGNNLKF